MWDPDCVASPGHELGTVSLPRCKACSSFGRAFSLHGFNLNLPWGSPPPPTPAPLKALPSSVWGCQGQCSVSTGNTHSVRVAGLPHCLLQRYYPPPQSQEGTWEQHKGRVGGGGGLVQSHKCWDEIPKLCLCTPRFQGPASGMALMGGSYSSLFNEDIKAWCSAPVCAWDESLGSNCAAKCSLPGTDM